MRKQTIGLGVLCAVFAWTCAASAGSISSGVFTEDFENGFDGWAFWKNDVGGTWTIATPPVAHSGTKVAYSGPLNSWRAQAILSPALIAGDSSVQADYYHLYNNSGADPIAFMISVNDGGWQTVKNYPWADNGVPRSIGGYVQLVPNYLTSMSSYMHETLDLTAFLSPGDSFRVIFYSAADYNYGSPGWAVDDLTITGLMPIPEPGTLALLALSGLALIRRRPV